MSPHTRPVVVVRAALILGWLLVSWSLFHSVGRLVDGQGPGGAIDWIPWLRTVFLAYGGLLLVGWFVIHITDTNHHYDFSKLGRKREETDQQPTP